MIYGLYCLQQISDDLLDGIVMVHMVMKRIGD